MRLLQRHGEEADTKIVTGLPENVDWNQLQVGVKLF